MEENKQIRIPLREDYRNGDLLRGRDVNKITHRVNELTGDIDKIDIDLSGKLDTSAYTEDKAAIESRIDGLAGELSTKEDISAHTADMEAIRASLDKKVEVSAYTENNTRLDGRINSVVNQCTRLDISKQDKLSAGTNITIDENNVISAEVPDLSEYATTGYVDTQITKHTLSGSNNVDITNNVVRAKGYVYNQKWNIFLGNTVEELGTNTFTNNGHVILGKGTGNRIQGESQIIFGNANTASTIYSSHSVVFGDENRLADDAFIYGSRNGTNGAGVFIVGDGNSIAADWSVAIGQRLRTSHKNEFAIGLGNVTHKTNQGTEYTGLSGDTLLSIGNGRTDFSNAIELMEDGTLYIEGIGNYNGTQIASGDNNVKSLQMVVSGIHDSISAKQDQLTAGSGITIDENNVISAQQPDLSPYALSADVATELATKVDSSAYTQDKVAMQASISANTTAITQLGNSKQDKLTAGANVQIENGVISATDTKYDLSPYAKTADVTTELAKKADASALTQVSVEINNRIAVDERSISGLEADKQDKLSAGTGIKIENNVISTLGSPAQIDDTATGTTTTWSSQKINEVVETKVAAAVDEMRITLTNLLPTGNVLAF